MSKVSTREHEIQEVEGFQIRACSRRGRLLLQTLKGKVGPWRFLRATKGSWTVKAFVGKFAKMNAGRRCRVYLSDGSEAPHNMLLKTVRSTY